MRRIDKIKIAGTPKLGLVEIKIHTLIYNSTSYGHDELQKCQQTLYRQHYTIVSVKLCTMKNLNNIILMISVYVDNNIYLITVLVLLLLIKSYRFVINMKT